MYLNDKTLEIILAKTASADSAIVPREMFESLCLQAATNGDADEMRVLVPATRIKELLTDPHNATTAALSIDTLRKLCQQAMGQPR